MQEFKLPKINNEFKPTQEEWDEFIKFQRIAKFQMQSINDTLRGGLTSRNLKSFRNTYVINSQDSLDNSYPLYVHFNIINEMIKIVSVKLSFWILNYRAYDTAAKSGGGATSGATGTASGGGATSGSGGGQTSQTESATKYVVGAQYISAFAIVTNVGDEKKTGKLIQGEPAAELAASNNHTHTVANHTHTTPNHTHPEHTHTTPAHTHEITYGIHEETNSPVIKFYISENEGVSYNDVFFGGYDTDKRDLEITSLLTGSGSKLIKFTSTTRARLSIQIEIKLDIRAR